MYECEASEESESGCDYAIRQVKIISIVLVVYFDVFFLDEMDGRIMFCLNDGS